MKYQEQYKYYIDLNFYIFKSIYFHLFFSMIDFIIVFCSIIDGIHINFNNNKKEKLYSITNILANILKENVSKSIIFSIITLYLILNILIYIFYNQILLGNNFIKFYTNFNEIFHFRFFILFYCNFFAIFKGKLLFASLIILIIFISVILYHFQFYHCDFFTPDFISIPYDNFSKIIDQCYLIIKFIIPFALKNQKIRDLVLTITYSILIFLSLIICYIILFYPIYLIQNIIFNIFRICCHYVIFILTTIFLIYRQEDYLSHRTLLIEILTTLTCIILSYLLYKNFPILKLVKYSNLNIYYFFHFYYSKDINYKLIFIANYNYHFIHCHQCLLCSKLKIKSNEFNSTFEIKSFFFQDFSFFQTLILFMESYVKYGFQTISKNKRILILILTTIKNKMFQKNNIHQYLTLFTIYKKLAQFNDIEMEKVRMLMSELHSVNSFLKISLNLLNNLDYIFQNENQKIKIEKILEIVENSAKLKNKEFRTYLFNNKEIKEVIFPLTICSILYEEIFNETLIKANIIQIRERYQEMEDTLNLYDINKQITFKLNIISGKIEFLRSGHEFYKYIGNGFYDIFPKELYECQKNYFQSLILFPPEPTKDSVPKNINSTFVIKINRNQNRIYNILHLNFDILFQNKHYNIIILDGYYYVTNNNFITFIKKNEEYFFGSSFAEEENDDEKKIIKFSTYMIKNNIKENEIKLQYSITNVDETIYNIYSYGNETDEDLDMNNSIRETKLETTDEKIFANMRAFDESSVQGSLASINSINGIGNFNMKGRRNLRQQKEVNDRFFLFQRLMIIFIFVLFILTIIELITKQNKKNILIGNYNVFASFRLVSRTYYYMSSAFIANTCLILKNKSKCINYIDLFNKDFLNDDNIKFDVNRYLIISNELKIRQETEYSNQFWNNIYKFNDENINALFEQIITYLEISNINDNGDLNYIPLNTTFSDAFKKTINAFTIVASSNLNYTLEPLFIFNFNEFKLLHYFHVEKRDWRISLYNIIINYDNFCSIFDSMNEHFHNKLIRQISNFKQITIIYLCINLIIELVEVIVIIFYIYNFEAVMLEIYFFLKKRVSLKEFRESFRTKIKKLKLLLQVYTIHPKIILDELNSLYSKYKKNIKEEKKSEKKKNSIELSTPPNITKNKKEEEEIFKTIKSTYIFTFYQRIYQITLIISLLIFLTFLLIWIELLSKTKILFEIINHSSQIESLNYQYFSFYQNLLYSTQSVKNRFNTTGKNLYELNLLQELAIFNVKREENKIGNILKKFYKTINLSCENFYYSINDQRINIMEEENPNDFFTQKLIKLCEKMQFLTYENFEFVMQKSFGFIYRGLLSLSELNEDNREIFFTNNTYYFESCYYNNFLLRIFRSGINNLIFTPSIHYFMDCITIVFSSSAIVEFVFEITFLLVVMFLFVFRINKIYKKLLRISKVVKVCKSNH